MSSAIELWHNKKQSWQEPVQLPDPTEGEVRVRSLYSMISAGTERVITTQEFNEETAERMAVPHLKGSLNTSFTYGYSIVGEVVTKDSELEGNRIHVMHPHQDLFNIGVQELYVLPEGMDPRLATLISNMETAVNAVWDAEIELGDRVLIIGYGLIGALLACVLREYPGLEIEIREPDIHRQQLATDHRLTLTDRERDYFDVVFNTSSSEEALAEAFRSTRTEGTIIELSWYGSRKINLRLGDHFHYGRKRLISSQVSHIPLRKQPIWDYRNRKDLVVKLLQSINPTHLLENEISFQETPGFYRELRSGQITHLSTIIKY